MTDSLLQIKNVTASTGKNEGFVDGEGATYVVTGSQTTVGSSDNTFTYTLNANTKAGNYEITTEAGTLTVTSNENEVVVQIKGNTKTKKYDGTAKTVSGYEIVSISNKPLQSKRYPLCKNDNRSNKEKCRRVPDGTYCSRFL